MRRIMNLAIASPSASAYSETFIHMQIERLPVELSIHGGPVANETVPGGLIKPLNSIRGVIDTVVECGIKGKRWEGPQSRELVRRLKAAKITIVLANYGPTGVALLPICRQLGIHLVVHFHGRDAHMSSVLLQHAENYRKLGKYAAAIVAVSEHMKKSLTSLGLPAAKISVHRCGVDHMKFTAKRIFPSPPLFFGVGRFVDKKAPYLTLLAFVKVLEKCPNAKLVLGGDGMLMEVAENLSNALGLAHAVTFLGVVKPQDVVDWMQRATAFVQHSVTPQFGKFAGDSEGTPVAVQEALICGLPVISTFHAGIAEIVIQDKTGILVEERDVSGMANAMVRLAADKSLAIQMGQAARIDALTKYTADNYIDGLLSVLANCCD